MNFHKAKAYRLLFYTHCPEYKILYVYIFV